MVMQLGSNQKNRYFIFVLADYVSLGTGFPF